jgi:hypothetical protein
VKVTVADQADNNPTAVSVFLAGTNGVQVCLLGSPIQVCSVEVSSDLANWQPNGTLTADSDGSMVYQFTVGTEPRLFYRFVQR